MSTWSKDKESGTYSLYIPEASVIAVIVKNDSDWTLTTYSVKFVAGVAIIDQKIAAQHYRSGLTPAEILTAMSQQWLRPGDTASGRENDVRRAYFDGVMAALRDLTWMLRSEIENDK